MYPDPQAAGQDQLFHAVKGPGLEDVYEVVEVIDGDTVRVKKNGWEESVRLIGIDTPEVASPYEKEECFGPEASQNTKQLLEGKEVKLVSDPAVPDKDKYGRLLRYVFLPDRQGSINAQLISQGFALYYPYQPFEYMDDFALLEKQAREGEKGLWGSACNYNK
jgi:micrococcal nuclease